MNIQITVQMLASFLLRNNFIVLVLVLGSKWWTSNKIGLKGNIILISGSYVFKSALLFSQKMRDKFLLLKETVTNSS